MSATCPNGHLSTAEDYCDTCGVPIPPGAKGSYAAEPASTGPPGPTSAGSGKGSSLDLDAEAPGSAPAPSTLECPNCHAPNPPGALFCEACGYDFTTGAMPRGAEPAASAPSTEEAPASPTPSTEAGPATTTPSSAQNPPSEPAFEWVAEVWVDPDWYRTQEAEDPCPSPGLPTIIPLPQKSVLLGRVSASKNTHPEVELSTDPGVSRRHAQLTTDGTRWFVEDLGSSNGTFVGPASGGLPDQPIPVGPKTELSDDDRLYVGAWTRVVVRRATTEEAETFA